MKRSFIFYSTLILIFIGTSSFLVNSYLNGVHQLKKIDKELESKDYSQTISTELFTCKDGSCNFIDVSEKED